MTPKPLQPRKSPTQARARETVAALLEAAAQILERLGRQAFNTNAVAERAGVSIGSLYQYFPGKEALLIALMRREKERFRDDTAEALALPTGREALLHLVGAAVRQQLARPELARLLDIEEERSEEPEELKQISGFHTVLRTILEREDLAPMPDPERVAADLSVIVQALVDAWGARGDHDADELERRLAGAVVGYLAAVRM